MLKRDKIQVVNKSPFWIVRNHKKNCLEVIQSEDPPGQVYEGSGPFSHELGLLLSQVDGPFFDSQDVALKLHWWREQHAKPTGKEIND